MGGVEVLIGHVPAFDSTVITKLAAAGAILLGKLNLTEGAMGGYNRNFAIPQNPWNPDRWTGSSSSGSGVATAAGLCFGSLGSDTGGSIRFPAAACGIVGIKPTWGSGEPLRCARTCRIDGSRRSDDPKCRGCRDYAGGDRWT